MLNVGTMILIKYTKNLINDSKMTFYIFNILHG
jgi:hypothetical protein